MSVAYLDDGRLPGCGAACWPSRGRHDPWSHWAHGFMLGRLVAVAPPITVVRTGLLAIDLSAQWVSIDGQIVQLSGREWGVLEYLAAHAGRWCWADDIVRAVWGEAWVCHPVRHRDDYHTLNSTLVRLRRKLGPAARLIATEACSGRSGRRLIVEAVP